MSATKVVNIDEVSSSSAVVHSPLKELHEAGMLSAKPSSELLSLVQSTNAALSSLPPVCKEFLSVQAAMLVHSKQLELSDAIQHGAKFDGRSFEGIMLSAIPKTVKGLRMDCYDADDQKIYLCPVNPSGYLPRTTSIESTLSHEMTHAIDDIYDDRKSGDRVLAILKHNDSGLSLKEFQEQVITKAADIVAPPGTDNTFQEAYCVPAIGTKGIPVSEACDAAENRTKTKRKYSTSAQEKAASNLLVEYASFAMENFFDEMKSGTDVGSRLIDRYKASNPEPSHSELATTSTSLSSAFREENAVQRAAQEVVAVAIDQVIGNMITHITERPYTIAVAMQHDVESTTLSAVRMEAPRAELLASLSELKATIAPAVLRANTKTLHLPASQIQETGIESDDSDDTTMAKRPSTNTSARIHNTSISQEIDITQPKHRNIRRSASCHQLVDNMINSFSEDKSSIPLPRPRSSSITLLNPKNKGLD